MIKIKTAWLIFRDGKHKLGSILKKDFGHVNFLTKKSNKWIELSPDRERLEIDFFDNLDDKDVPILLVKAGLRVFEIKYETVDRNYSFPRILIGFSCVSFVKYALGYKDYSLTPYGLCKNLKKLNKNIVYFEEIQNG